MPSTTNANPISKTADPLRPIQMFCWPPTGTGGPIERTRQNQQRNILIVSIGIVNTPFHYLFDALGEQLGPVGIAW